MDTNLSLEFIIAIATLIAGIIAIMRVLINFKSDLQKDIHKLEVEVKTEIIKLQHRFDVSEGKQTDIEKQLTEIRNETAKQNEITTNRFIQMETENKNYIKELMNKVLEVLPKSIL